MSTCTCTNGIYERVRPPASLHHQPKSANHPTTAKTSSNPSRRTVRNKTVTLSGAKLSSRPEQTCHYPRFWPDSHCLKTSNRRLTCHLTSMHQTSELLFHRFPPTIYRPTASSRGLHPRPQSNLIPGLKLTCLTLIYRMYSTLPPGSSLPARLTLPDPPSKLFVKF